MGKAFMEMGVIGKVIVVLIIASTTKECVRHIAETIRINKEASPK